MLMAVAGKGVQFVLQMTYKLSSTNVSRNLSAPIPLDAYTNEVIRF